MNHNRIVDLKSDMNFFSKKPKTQERKMQKMHGWKIQKERKRKDKSCILLKNLYTLEHRWIMAGLLLRKN